MHHSAIGGDGFKTLADGEAVEYEVEDNPENGKARAVRRDHRAAGVCFRFAEVAYGPIKLRSSSILLRAQSDCVSIQSSSHREGHSEVNIKGPGGAAVQGVPKGRKGDGKGKGKGHAAG